MFGPRVWAVVAVIVSMVGVLTLCVGCDEPTGKVCCECECAKNTGDENPPIKYKTISGENLSCKDSCETECKKDDRYELTNFIPLDCDDI